MQAFHSKYTMEDIEKELPQLVNRLLQSPAAKQRQLIEQLYTPDCRLTHPLLIANNREEIIKVFQYWTQFATAHLEAQFEDIIYSADHKKCAYFFTQKITKFQHLPISFNLPMAVLLYFTKEENGNFNSNSKGNNNETTTKWKISKQIDLHSFEGILYNAPLLGPVLEVAVRGVSTWTIIGGMTAFENVSNSFIVRRMKMVVDKVVPEEYREMVKEWFGKVWWQEKADSYQGRIVAPYDVDK